LAFDFEGSFEVGVYIPDADVLHRRLMLYQLVQMVDEPRDLARSALRPTCPSKSAVGIGESQVEFTIHDQLCRHSPVTCVRDQREGSRQALLGWQPSFYPLCVP
jgi:hypothetical protein